MIFIVLPAYITISLYKIQTDVLFMKREEDHKCTYKIMEKDNRTYFNVNILYILQYPTVRIVYIHLYI